MIGAELDSGSPTESDEKAELWRAYVAFLGVAALGYLGLLAFVFGFGLYGEQLTAGVEEACAEAAYQSGKKMEDRGNSDRAIHRYRQAREGRFRDPAREYECMRSIGEVLYRLHRYQEAIDAYRGLPPVAFREPGHWTAYVLSLYYAGENADAERLSKVWLAKAEQGNDLEQQVWAHGALGRLFEGTERLEQALSHYGAASALEPGSQASILAARILHRLGRTREAVERLDAFLERVESGVLHENAKRLRAKYAQADT